MTTYNTRGTARNSGPLILIEHAAEALETTPYWVRQQMRARGFKEVANGSLYIRREDFQTLRHQQADRARQWARDAFLDVRAGRSWSFREKPSATQRTLVRDVLAKNPEVVAQLKSELARWRAKLEAARPGWPAATDGSRS